MLSRGWATEDLRPVNATAPSCLPFWERLAPPGGQTRRFPEEPLTADPGKGRDLTPFLTEVLSLNSYPELAWQI